MARQLSATVQEGLAGTRATVIVVVVAVLVVVAALVSVYWSLLARSVFLPLCIRVRVRECAGLLAGRRGRANVKRARAAPVA